MKFFTNYKKNLIILILLLAGISISTAKSEQLISGWVEVSFNIDKKYISLNKGKLDELYDEFVGGLIDDGLPVEKSHWIKPTYGNKNLLWTLDSKIAKEKIKKLESSKDKFIATQYKFINGSLKIKNKKWSYFGYSTPIGDSTSKYFKSYILSCEKNDNISIFYWGNDNINLLKNNQSIIQLLETLSKKC